MRPFRVNMRKTHQMPQCRFPNPPSTASRPWCEHQNHNFLINIQFKNRFHDENFKFNIDNNFSTRFLRWTRCMVYWHWSSTENSFHPSKESTSIQPESGALSQHSRVWNRTSITSPGTNFLARCRIGPFASNLVSTHFAQLESRNSKRCKIFSINNLKLF